MSLISLASNNNLFNPQTATWEKKCSDKNQNKIIDHKNYFSYLILTFQLTDY